MSQEQQSTHSRKVAIGINTVGFNCQFEPPLKDETSDQDDAVNLESKPSFAGRISIGCRKLLSSPEWCIAHYPGIWKLAASEYLTRLLHGLGGGAMFFSESLSFISIMLMLLAVLSPRFSTAYKSSENPNDKSCYMHLGFNVFFTVATAFMWYFYGASSTYLITKIIETLILSVISVIFHKKTKTN